MTATWQRVDDPAERERLLDQAIEHQRVVRTEAEGHTRVDPRGRRGEIWTTTTDTGTVTVWVIPGEEHVHLGDVAATRIPAAPLADLLSALAVDAGWHGSWQFSAYAGDEMMSALAEGEDAHRVATKMQLEVAGAAEPYGIRLRPMSDDEYTAYRAVADEGYAQERFASGADATIEEAREVAAQQMAALLPQRQRTEGHRLWTVRDDDGVRVGLLWVHLREASAFIYDIAMEEQMRGRGFGTQTLRAAAAQTRRAGLSDLCLNVFGSNESARRLYTREGYRETEALWTLPIT